MDIITIAHIEAIIDIIASKNGNTKNFPSLKKLKNYDGNNADILKLKIYALEKDVIE